MFKAFCPFALCLCLAPSAQAEVRALLVGVSDYLVLDADLKGPAADVALMAEVLAGRGVPATSITALTSEPVGLAPGIATGQPTRAGILAAMQATAQAAQSGDTVVFYFSGHGAQAPDMSGDEGGGYDEILLPADAAGWKGAIGAVENALVDDELQAWAQGLLSRNVRLVGLIDACHSATGFRDLAGQGVARGLSEEALGIPADVISAQGAPAAPLQGEFVFLYSSQSDQRSFEYPLGDGGPWHGEFTLRLAETLRSAPQASWAQVLAATSDAMVQGAARQLPDGEGPLLDAPVFGQGDATLRHAVREGAVQAGLLHGLTPGDTLTFYATPAGGEPLGQAVLGKVEARKAAVTAPDGALWAEVSSRAPPAPLVLGPPLVLDGQDYSAWLGILPAPGAKPDLIPVLTGGELRLASPDASPETALPVVQEAGDTPAMALDYALERMGHAIRLRKLLAGMAGRSLTGKAPLAVSYERHAGTPDGQGCTSVGGRMPYTPDQPLAPCDALFVSFTNTSGKTVDVSALWFAADFTVVPIYPSRRVSNRLAPGETGVARLIITPDSPAAVEELFLIAVPVDPDGDRVDLTRLAEPETQRALKDASSATELWFQHILSGEDTATRGFSTRPAALLLTRQVLRLAP